MSTPTDPPDDDLSTPQPKITFLQPGGRLSTITEARGQEGDEEEDLIEEEHVEADKEAVEEAAQYQELIASLQKPEKIAELAANAESMFEFYSAYDALREGKDRLYGDFEAIFYNLITVAASIEAGVTREEIITKFVDFLKLVKIDVIESLTKRAVAEVDPRRMAMLMPKINQRIDSILQLIPADMAAEIKQRLSQPSPPSSEASNKLVI